jgi:hypothetical protein
MTTALKVAGIETKVGGIEATAAKLELHARTTNGQIADILKEQYIQHGGIAVLRAMVTWTLAGIGAGAAVAGVILALVARGV